MKHLGIGYRFVLFAVMAAALSSCLDPQPQAPALLEQAELLMEDRPDSAMRLIDSIFYPEKSLRKPQYMQYLVTRVQARYKNYRPVAEDTLIFAATDYFVSKDEDPRRITLAYFYSGCVYREQEDYTKAMQQYNEAERYAAKTGDTDLRGLVQYNMGDLLAEEGLYAEALEQYKTTETWYRQSSVNPNEKQAKCLAAIGRMLLLLGEQDSAFAAFHRGLELAKTSGSSELQSLLAQNLSIGYKESGQYAEAEKYLRRSFALEVDSAELPRYYLNFAQLYSEMKQQDSALLYINKLVNSITHSDDLYFKASAYSLLAENEKENQNYARAFEYQKRQMDVLTEIMEKRKNRSVYEVRQKYDFEYLQSRYNKKLLDSQKWTIILLGVVVAVVLLFSAYILRKRRQDAEMAENLNTIREMNRDLEAITQQKNTDLRKELLWRLNVAQKVMDLNKIMVSGTKNSDLLLREFNRIVYGTTDIAEQWNALFNAFNNARPGYADKIRARYPDLTDNEFRICILTYAGFRIKEIALILKQSPNTIQTRRTEVRRKTGTAQGEDFADFLDRKIL